MHTWASPRKNRGFIQLCRLYQSYLGGIFHIRRKPLINRKKIISSESRFHISVCCVSQPVEMCENRHSYHARLCYIFTLLERRDTFIDTVYFPSVRTLKESRLVQSIECLTINLKVVGSSPTVGKIFHFVLLRFLLAPRSSAESIQMKSSITFIRGKRCIVRMITWKKYGGGTSTFCSTR